MTEKTNMLQKRAMENREARIHASAARDWNGDLRLLHHVTLYDYEAAEMAPFTHFGTRQAARDRIKIEAPTVDDEQNARLFSAWLDIRSPMEISDIDDEHNALHIAELVMERRSDVLTQQDFDDMLEMEAGPSEEYLRELLLAAGIDGLFYKNGSEDLDSKSWIILDASQVIVQKEGPIKDSLDPWDYSLDDFIGPSIVSETFAIDGEDEEYAHLWADLRESGPYLPVMTSQDGWTVRWLSDWNPEATLGLYDESGEAKGFYMGAQLWIEEEARGRGLSKLLIKTAADILGHNPTSNTSGMGFSSAGFGAHESAWRAIIHEAGKDADLSDMSPDF